MRLHRSPATVCDPRKVRLTLVAPLLLTVYGLVMPVLLLNWYVKPYQAGTGELLADGTINWTGTEALVAFGPGLLFVPLGLISAWVIWRRYQPQRASRVPVSADP